MKKFCPAAVLLAAAGHFSCPEPMIPDGAQTYTYRIVAEYPHDAEAFTQGLVFDGGVFYEGTGLNGQSTLRRVAIETGEVLESVPLAQQYFGEGIAVYEDTILQLTWRSHKGFIYNKETLEKTGEFAYPTEGWGITHDGERIIMSDGTSTIRFRDPVTFQETGSIAVAGEEGAVTRLNELEYVDGRIFANVWHTEFIAVIDPESGEVDSWIDLSGLRPEDTLGDTEAVLNGIAHDPETGRLFVTGKRWPTVFEIELVPVD